MKKVAIIGHVGHGKISLQSAIDSVLGKEKVEVLSKNNEDVSPELIKKLDDLLKENPYRDDYLKIEPIPKFEETKFYEKPKSKYHK